MDRWIDIQQQMEAIRSLLLVNVWNLQKTKGQKDTRTLDSAAVCLYVYMSICNIRQKIYKYINKK